jgi:pectate lyase
MDQPWAERFQHAYNRNLIVNSQLTNQYGSYTGSSWDHNGENLFTKGFTWYDKSTIGKWAWSSHIVGSEEMSKTNPPAEPFTFQYNYSEKLPYAYNVVPLDSVLQTLTSYAGAGKLNMSPVDWLKTEYSK